jgi:SAM-dependent methyltransferase
MTDPVDHFGESVAEHYDETSDAMFAPEAVDPVVSFLARLADSGPVLELAIGTGRIALPLAARGLEVHGIELSDAMVARLRAKPGGDALPVTIGDMTLATAGRPGAFRLVYLVFNTIMNVTSQAGQVDVFRNAARHLAPGGRFVIETMVPDLRRLPPGERYVVFDVSDDHLGIDEYDVLNQGLVSHHVQAFGARLERSSGPFRYVWPAELDLMARLAGMDLTERWAGWNEEPFTSESRSHVSVWRKA